LTVRLEHQSFSFTHSIFSFGLQGLTDWQENVLLGIFWSDLARYYLFLTTGSWGMWHDELSMTSIARMPIAMPAEETAASELVRVVDELRSFDPTATTHLASGKQTHVLEELEARLNKAVFDLYELNVAERDLIADMCNTGLDFLYGKQASSAVRALRLPAVKVGLAGRHWTKADTEIEEYIQLFLRPWSKDLDSRARLRWQLFSSNSGAPLLAVVFSTHIDESSEKAEQLPEQTDDWNQLLRLLDGASVQPINSRQIYVDSFIRLVTENAIVLVKRNEKRFWTRSAARQDAEAIQLRAMLLQGALRQ
jgi:hypothetical protein